MAKLAWKERTSTHQRFCCISGGLTDVLWYQRQCWKYEFFFKYFVYLFLESEQGREKERERNINVWLPLTCPPNTGDLACNPGMCPDWESNQRPFGLQASTQSTEPHQPGQKYEFFSW